ncbi:MAG TPA: sensor domain-containing diguanylate cyclase [Gammaproteobacteria bacterium]|nr:sensor domain-containing diguanylate cyclase [Gammaproteobacteria bacterium]
MNVPQHTLRITLSLVMLTIGLLLLGQFAGLLPDQQANELKHRQQLCETLAIQVSSLPIESSLKVVDALARSLVARYPEIRTAGLRRGDGTLLFETPEHRALWSIGTKISPERVAVPIYSNTGRWGALEVSFTPLSGEGVAGFLNNSFVHFLAFMALFSTLLYYLLIRRALKHLDPSAVIPARVRAALDVLAEGVILADDEANIVMSNRSFAAKLNTTPNDMLGRTLSSLPWANSEPKSAPIHLAWEATLQKGQVVTGVPMYLETHQHGMRTLMVNSAPITDEDGHVRGAIITFDDVTQLEEKNAELEDMLRMLKDTQDKIHRQNQELQTLAVKDPLTGCLNRRGLFERLNAAFDKAKQSGGKLSCVMCDIDNFKVINDTHGHNVGDRVIRTVADVLRSGARESDVIARYGGEEFCLMLPGLSLQLGSELAERLRRVLAGLDTDGIKVTASFGVSSMEVLPADAEGLLKQADVALYRAKRSGRNRVVTHTLPEDNAHPAVE